MQMAGGSFMDGLSFGGGMPANPYARAPTSAAPAPFLGGSSTGYVAPDPSALAAASLSAGPGEGPLLGGFDA